MALKDVAILLKNTVEYLAKINNPTFNCAEFDIIKSQAGLNSYRLSAKEWMAKTNVRQLFNSRKVKIF